jgi:PAS domain S-box-containing protein
VPDPELYKDLAENSLGLMCVHDLDGVLLWVNRAVGDALGYPIEAGIGQNLATFLPSELKVQFPAYLDRMRRNATDSGVLRLRAADGSEHIWSYRNVLVDTHHGARVLGHALDITHRLRAERALKESKERFRALFQEAPVAYLEIERGGAIRRVNDAACTLLGCAGSDLVGRSLWDFIEESDRARAAAAFQQMLSLNSTSVQDLFVAPTTDGRRLSIEVHLNAIFDREGAFAGARCAMLDLSERLWAEEQVRRMNTELEARVAERTAELQRSNEELEQFAYVISHDLKAPLRHLRGLLAGSAQNRLEDMLATVGRMETLISRLLEYSIAANAPPRPARSVSVGDVIRESIANLETAVRQSRAKIDIGEMPTLVVDPTTLVQVFQNIIANALKYSAPAVPVVGISAQEDGDNWMFSVQDNGPGIAPEFREQVFQAFRRLHGPEHPGAGVGLAICKKVIERNGGRIWVDSQEGRGCTFRFTLPK